MREGCVESVSLSEIKALVKDVSSFGNSDITTDVLLQSIKDYPEKADILEFCIGEIWNFCEASEDYIKSVISTNAPDEIVQAMELHFKDALIQGQSCGALYSLCSTPANRKIIIRAGATASIVKAILEHINKEDVVSSGLGCLRGISLEAEARESIFTSSGIYVVCEAMRAHCNVAWIQRDGCAFICNCAVDVNSQQVSKVSDAEIEAIANAMCIHQDDLSVIAGGCFAIKNMIIDESNEQRIRQMDGISELLKKISQHCEDPCTRKDATSILEKFQASENDAFLENQVLESILRFVIRDFSIATHEKIKQAIYLMKEYGWSRKVCAAILQSLTLLSQQYPDQRESIACDQMIQCVVTCMRKYEDFTPIQINGCKLLHMMVKCNDSCQSTILDMEGGEAVITAMTKHTMNDQVQGTMNDQVQGTGRAGRRVRDAPSKDFDNFRAACATKSVTLVMIKSFINKFGQEMLFSDGAGEDKDYYEVPLIQHLYDARPSFEVTNYLFTAGIMKKIEGDLYDKFLSYKNEQLGWEVIAAAKMGGCVPIRRGRVTFVGQGRAGKTSTIRSLRNERHDDASKSTIGIDVENVNVCDMSKMNDTDMGVRDLGVDITDNVVSEDGEGAWFKARSDGCLMDRAIQTQLLREGFMDTDSDAAMFRLLKKYKFGKNITDGGKGQDFSLLEKSQNFDDIETDQEETKEFDDSEIDREKKKEQTKASSMKDDVNRVVSPLDNKPSDSVVGNNPKHFWEHDEEEDNVMKEHDKLLADDQKGNEFQLSVWDFGGQVVFRAIQHLYLLRHSCYVVIFNLTDMIGGDKKVEKTALQHLQFWLKSIEIHAISDDGNDQNTLPTMRYAPVVLVGTHFDGIKKSAKCEEKLHEINQILVDEFGDIEVFPRNKGGVNQHRNFLHNSKQELCFWPVDNTDSNDESIQELRHIIVKGVVEDPQDYINDSVPSSWLDCIDELDMVSKEEYILSLYSKGDDEMISVLSIMHKCNALEDINPNINDYDTQCERRAVAFMQFCHQVGAVVYFDDIPGMQGFCILDAQWVLDTITYVIRNYKMHRLRRDYRAMRVRNGSSWNNLLEKGILDIPLLRKLWLGESDNFNFLVHLMLKIGIFAPLPITEGEELRFLVPDLVTAPFSVGSFSDSRIAAHINSRSVGDWYSGSFDFGDFLPTGFYTRVVSKLISTFNKGYTIETHPELLPNGCLMNMGSKEFPFALVLRYDSNSIDVVSASEDHEFGIYPYVQKAMEDVNTEIYNGNVSFKSRLIVKPDIKIERELKRYCDSPSIFKFSPSKHQAVTPSGEQMNAEKVFISFLRKKEIPEKKATVLVKTMIEADPNLDLQDIVRIFDGEEDDKIREILREDYGVMKELEQTLIIKAFKNNRKKEPSKEEKYLIGYFGGDKVHHLEKEKESIDRLLAPAHLCSSVASMENVNLIRELTTDDNCKVLHLAMHGIVSNSGEQRSSLVFKNKNGVTINADDFVETISFNCACDNYSKDRQGSIQCIFLNACKSNDIAEVLKEKHGVPWIVSWNTLVNDEAARNFAEGFYYYLGSSKKNSLKFTDAFNLAHSELKLRGWATIDPEDKEGLLKHQEMQNNVLLEAAGIPILHQPAVGFELKFTDAVNLGHNELKLRGGAINDPEDKYLLKHQEMQNNMPLEAAGVRDLREPAAGLESDEAESQNENKISLSDDPCRRAISYRQLLVVEKQAKDVFGVDYPNKTMREVNEKIIKPMCLKEGKPYSIYLNPDGLELDVFVSHSWDEPFGEFVNSIKECYQNKLTKPNLWICVFALFQGNFEDIKAEVGTDEEAPLDYSPFIMALKHAKEFLVVRNRNTDIFSRIWCICEVMYAKKFHFIPHKTLVSGPNKFAEADSSCIDANCFVVADKVKILRELFTKHNVDEIDEYIQKFRTFDF